MGQGPQFRVHDPSTKRSVWVGLNERNAELDVLVKQHGRDDDTLTIEHRGTIHTLPIRKAKVVSGGPVPTGLPPPMPAPANVAPAVTQSVVVNPSPADEATRLQAVAAEVARRRALREQAQTTVNQAQSPSPPPPMQSR
ncbi:MAG: hypothetical protein JNL39_10455 [Opitutaceae bacterium]|nr:hypothetical protein [Opitutaceae bacterium]